MNNDKDKDKDTSKNVLTHEGEINISGRDSWSKETLL